MDIYITKILGGYKIKHYNQNSRAEIMLYYDYTLNQAIVQHRKNFNLQRKHLNKIYL